MNNPQSAIHNPQSPWRWWVCGILMFATLLNYMDRQVLPQIATELLKDYNLDAGRYGIVSRNFAWAFAVGAIFFGLIADRVGPRLLYPFVLIGWSAAGLATPLMANPGYTSYLEDPNDPGSGPYLWLLYCRTLLGFFEAGHWPCALLTARQVLTARDRPLGNGLLQSGASLGAILVPPYIAAVRHLGGGWEIAFLTIGGIGLLWVPVWLLLVRRGDLDHRADAPIANSPAVPSPPFRWGHFIRVYITLFCIILGINASWQFIREWLPKYMKESQGFSADTTDFIVPAYYISAEIGCFGFGLLVRYLVVRGRGVHSARVTGYAVFAGITALAALVPVVGGGWPAVIAIVLAGAGILGLHPCYYALVQELPAKHMAMLAGFLTCTAWFTVGKVHELMGEHIKATGSYDVGFVLAGLAPLAGLVALVLLWRK